MRPHIKAASILDIDFRRLHSSGIRFVIFDKDNTLAPHLQDELRNKAYKEKLDEVKEIFGEANVCIYSNDFNAKQLLFEGENYPIRFAAPGVKKPLAGDTICMHFNQLALEENPGVFFEGEKSAIVGDRLLSDVMQGHNLGGVSVYVEPWDLESESRKISIPRRYEQFVWKWFLDYKLEKFKNKDISDFLISKKELED